LPALATSTTRARRCRDTELTTAKAFVLKAPEAFGLCADELIESLVIAAPAQVFLWHQAA